MKKLFTLLIILITAGFAFADGIKYAAADESPAIRFYNRGTETVTIKIYAGGASATNEVIIGSITNTVDGSGDTDTVAELATAIAACTNSAGLTVLTMDTDCSLATDSTDGELLDGTAYTAASGAWGELLWDTSDVKFYSVYIADQYVKDNTDGARPSVDIDTVYGNPLGTGDVTLSIYLDGNLAWQALMPEVFEYTNNTATIALPADIDIPAQKKAVLIRAARETTATTGMIGVKTVPTDQK